MRILALLALLLGFIAQLLLDGQIFTHAIFGIGCGIVAVVCGLGSALRDPPHRWAGRIMAALGVVLGIWCGVVLPSAYRFEKNFNAKRERRLETSAARIDWPGVPYSDVRGYFYNLDGAPGAPILQNGHLHETVVDTNGMRLTQQQIEQLLDAVARPHPADPVASCYMPRHAFIFYDGSKPVGFVEICFDCSNYQTSPSLPHRINLSALERLCRDVGLPVLARGKDYRALKSGASGKRVD